MENAAKALEIAGGILIAALVVSVLIISYNNMKALPDTQEQVLSAQQLQSFNQSFLSYNSQNLQGIDMISLINKAEDNEKNKEYPVTIKFTITKRINIQIVRHYLNVQNKWSTNIYKDTSNISLYVGTYSSENVIQYMKNESTFFGSLKNNIGNQTSEIYCDENGDTANGEEYYTKRYEKDIFPSTSDSSRTGKGQYFTLTNPYTEFKKKKFKCTNVGYNENGRVNLMEFVEI